MPLQEELKKKPALLLLRLRKKPVRLSSSPARRQPDLRKISRRRLKKRLSKFSNKAFSKKTVVRQSSFLTDKSRPGTPDGLIQISVSKLRISGQYRKMRRSLRIQWTGRIRQRPLPCLLQSRADLPTHRIRPGQAHGS